MPRTLIPPRTPAAGVHGLQLTHNDARSVAALAQEYIRAANALSAARARCLAAVLAHELPRPMRRALLGFRILSPRGAGLFIRGLPLDFGAVPSAPAAYRAGDERPEPCRADAFLLLVGSLLGEPMPGLGRPASVPVVDVHPVPGPPAALPGWLLRGDWLLRLGIRGAEPAPGAEGTGRRHPLELPVRQGELLVLDSGLAAGTQPAPDAWYGAWSKFLSVTADLRWSERLEEC